MVRFLNEWWKILRIFIKSIYDIVFLNVRLCNGENMKSNVDVNLVFLLAEKKNVA